MIDHTDALAAEYDRTVREDIELFRQKAEEYLAGSLSDNEFRAMRLRRGIYGQRQAGVQMVRTKIPGGLLTAPQLTQLANVSDEYSDGRAHLTTRQNLQFHFVPLRSVPDMLHKLADFRLTTREACYNTVRNVTGCVYAGLHPDEVFDVRPYAQRVALAFLHKDLTDNLPRKFKITLCGCGQDCTAAAINDIGLKAVIVDGRRGFQMVIGGGLGSLPHEARLLEEFLPEEHLVQKCEAMIRVFGQHGNRGNKMKARFKFIIRERGFDWVRETIEREFQDILANGGITLPDHVPEGFGGFLSEPPALGEGRQLPVVGNAVDARYDRWLESNVREQKQPGYASVVVRVDQGNLSSGQMRGLAALSSDAADGFFRVTIDQNLVLAYVPLTRLRPLHAALQRLELAAAGANEIEDVTTCPGAYTCNLGLTKSMNLGAALSEAVRAETDPEIR
ncbi:MAG: nitrite/sulfite reductase, partial [Acidobacteria bacterium]|nr:nitrite/sulfite reductase [Acidobacteriota bacterium]